MEVDPKKPTIYLRAKNLWHDATVSVFGIGPPDPGEVKPNYFLLCRLDSPAVVACNLPVYGNPPRFDYPGIAFAVTAGINDVGTVSVEVMRAQDMPAAPPFEPPVHTTLELNRANVAAALTVEKSLALTVPKPVP
jgi:hypothetical protein